MPKTLTPFFLLLFLLSSFILVSSLFFVEASLNNNKKNIFSGLLSNNKKNQKSGETCQGLDGQSIQCPAGEDCCGSGCIEFSCMNASSSKCCTWWISATQCDLDQDCCGMLGTGASSDAFCCGAGSTCCETEEDGSSQCCTKDEICCKGENSYCCDKDGSCCMDTCCNKGQTCCGDTCCDDASQVCDTNTNTCQWATAYPTYSPGGHYKPYQMIWHVNGSTFNPPQQAGTLGAIPLVSSSNKNDFIVFGTNIISRVGGVDGAPIWTTTIELAKYSTKTQAFFLRPVVNEAASLVFNFGLGLDLATGKIVYEMTPQFGSVCPWGTSVQLSYQTSSIMTFYCWASTPVVAYVFATVSAKSGVVLGHFAPSSNREASSVSPTTANTGRTNAILYESSSINANTPTYAIVGIDALTSKVVFDQKKGDSIPFSPDGSTPQIVDPTTDPNGFYMSSSTPNSQFTNALDIFMIQQSNFVWALNSHSGKLLWTQADCYSPDAVFPFTVVSTSSSNTKKMSRHAFVKSLGASTENVVAWTSKKGYVHIFDQITGDLIWNSPTNMTTSSASYGPGRIMYGASKHLLFGISTTTIFAIDTTVSSSGNASFSVRWSVSNTNGFIVPSAKGFTSMNSAFLFIQNDATLLILSPADGSILHSWPLLAQTDVLSVYVDDEQTTARVVTSSGISLYQL